MATNSENYNYDAQRRVRTLGKIRGFSYAAVGAKLGLLFGPAGSMIGFFGGMAYGVYKTVKQVADNDGQVPSWGEVGKEAVTFFITASETPAPDQVSKKGC